MVHGAMRPRRPRWFKVLFGVVLSVMVALVGLGVWGAHIRDQGPSLARTGPYTWHQEQLPAGITVSGLQDFIMSPAVVSTMERQVYAASHYWHANTVRFQVTQDRLVGVRGDRYEAYYMNDIRRVTDYSLRQHMTVVLNAQTELATGYAADESLPTHATRVFWRDIMHYYKNNPRVVFDLFNEPRRCNWDQWQAAFQGLVNYVRASGANNVIWVEGLRWASTLEGVPLLHGKGIVYSYHHPGSPWPWQAPLSVTTWDHAFGDLADSGVPVVDGEFANYVGSYYWRDGRTWVPRYLRYLTAHHIGLLAWSLVPGALNRTRYYGSTSFEPQGDGYLIRQWFALARRS